MKVLLDSDFVVALYKRKDSNHTKAVKLFRKIENESLVAINLVFQESTTVISKQMGMKDAKIFLGSIRRIIGEEIKLNNILEVKSWEVFLRQNKKGTSFVDCANLAILKEYNLDKIASFDKFYPNDMLLN